MPRWENYKKSIMGLALAAFLFIPANAAWAGGAAANGAAEPAALPTAPQPVARVPQASQELSTLRLGQPIEANPLKAKGFDEAPSRRKWIALAAVEHGAAAFDAYTTRQAISRGAVEADPFMRPFANSPGLYVAIQAAPVMLDYVARRMQRSQNLIVRKMWWLPQTSGTAMYLVSGAHNLGMPRP